MKNNEYDVIVIGAGNGGLTAALTLQKKGKKVLLLEKGRVPGGFASSFIRGRFEFEASLHELCEYGEENNKGEVYEIFEKLGINHQIETKIVPETFCVYETSTNNSYEMPIGENEFLDKMESYVPNSKESMKMFFSLCREVQSAFEYFNETKGHPDSHVLMEKFPRFMVVAPYSVEKVLKKIKMPLKARKILETYWSYLGSPASKLSFVHYASMTYSYITKGPVILNKNSHQISLMLSEEFQKSGGIVKYLTAVKEIIINDNQVEGVITNDNQRFLAKHIISNVSPTTIYKKLINKESVPLKAIQNINTRILGPRGICVYLGLNKTMNELGLKNYSYFVYETLNSDQEYHNMHHTFNHDLVATIKDNDETSSILCLTTLVFGNDFTKIVNKDNYFELKEKIAAHYVSIFEKALKVNIRDAIEEIEVATPLTFARYGGHPDGAIYGYFANKYDNLLPRIMTSEQEVYIKGLRFCGGFGSRLSGYSSAYINGYQEALKMLGEINNETV